MTQAPSNDAINLAEAGQALLASIHPDDAGGRAARTLIHEPELRATLIALRAGHELAEHDAPPAATLYVHTGQVRLFSQNRDLTMTSDTLASIPHERHSLSAVTDAVVLLTVRFA